MIEQIGLFENAIPSPVASIPQEEEPQSELRKKAYNRDHYAKNRAEILEKSKARYHRKKGASENIIPLFSEDGPVGGGTPPKRLMRRNLPSITPTLIFLHILVFGFVYYLISETSSYFSKTDPGTLGAVFKSVLLEGAVLAFWLRKARTTFAVVFQKVMAVVIYIFTVAIVSQAVFQVASQQRSEGIYVQKTIAELETEIQKSTSLRDRYLEADRVTLGRRLSRSLEEMRSKLNDARERLMRIPDITLIWTTLAIQVFFRILIMVSNLFCLTELARRYRQVNRSI